MDPPASLFQMDDFFLKDMMYGDSDSEDEITCTSCARGRSRHSIMMPRLPHYKVVHQKKADYRLDLGVAEKSNKRVLGRGRAKCKPINLVNPGKGSDSASESSADERIKHLDLPRINSRWKTELRKPKTKPKILSSDFPQLVASRKPEPEQTLSKEKTDNPANFEDMAKFLMDSWQDEVGSGGQFDDAVSGEEQLSKNISKLKGDNSEMNKINVDGDIDFGIKQKTDEYFNKLEQEVDNEDLGDFEDMDVSEYVNKAVIENFTDEEVKSSIKAKTKTMNGIWYSSDDVYVSGATSNAVTSDFSDDTDLSESTESILPCDQLNNTSPVKDKNFSCDGDDIEKMPQRNFDLTLPGASIIDSQGNVSNNAISISSTSNDHSTLSSSKTESESKHTSVTSDKDESDKEENWKTLSRKEKKKKRDAQRAKVWHNKFSDKEKPNTNTKSCVDLKSKKNESSQSDTNTSKSQSMASSSWRLSGDSVIQLDGLPVDCDISVLQDLIASYGTVKDFEKKIGTHSSSVRFRLNDVDACEMVVSCLDDTDIFPDAASKITCIVVQ